MKIIIRISLFIALWLFLAECNKQLLHTVPDDRVSTAVFWKTAQDATLGANAVYTYLEGTNIFTWAGISDIGHTNQPFTDDAALEDDQYDATNSRINNEWANAYAGIYAANTFFANVDKVETPDTALIARLKAEVRVLRAYQYMHLVMLYGDVPLLTTPIDVNQAENLTRTPADSIWDFIDQELTEAATELPLTQADQGRITKGAALALDARAMLYGGRYQKAANAAKEVMNLGVYTLYPSYQNLFAYAGEENSGVILEKEFLNGTYMNNVFGLMAPYSQNSGGSNYVPTKNLIDSFQMKNGMDITNPNSGYDPYHPYDNRDPRLRYSIFVPGDTLPDGTVYDSYPNSNTRDAVGSTFYATSTGFNLKKYINAEDLANPNKCGINIILLRYAEVLLTYAEAKIELNQIDQSVYQSIDEVRGRPDVDMPPIPDPETQDQLRATVRHERMVEFAFEGFRFYDIRRWKIAENVMQGNVYGMTYSENGILNTIQVTAFQRIFNKSRDYLWPIPYKETLLDPELSQNPGW